MNEPEQEDVDHIGQELFDALMESQQQGQPVSYEHVTDETDNAHRSYTYGVNNYHDITQACLLSSNLAIMLGVVNDVENLRARVGERLSRICDDSTSGEHIIMSAFIAIIQN